MQVELRGGIVVGYGVTQGFTAMAFLDWGERQGGSEERACGGGIWE